MLSIRNVVKLQKSWFLRKLNAYEKIASRRTPHSRNRIRGPLRGWCGRTWRPERDHVHAHMCVCVCSWKHFVCIFYIFNFKHPYGGTLTHGERTARSAFIWRYMVIDSTNYVIKRLIVLNYFVSVLYCWRYAKNEQVMCEWSCILKML